MIYIKDNKTQSKNPVDEVKKLDGVYYSIICNVANSDVMPTSTTEYYCSLYIPTVYDTFDKDNIQNYPTVKIPYKQDNDDPGHTPQIGELCKVMFENGNNDSCKLVYVVPIRDENRYNNELFIKYGIVSTEILDKPEDINTTEKLRILLDTAYYVTTGKFRDDVTAEDFELCVLGSKSISKDSGWWFKPKDNTNAISAAKNYFCKPLGMPMFSYFTKDMNSIHVPIKSSQIYSIENVILDLYGNNFAELNFIDPYYQSSSYDFQIQDIISPYQIYNIELNELKKQSINTSFESIDELDDFMFKFMLSSVANCNPDFLSIIFPDIVNPTSKINNALTMPNPTLINNISKCYSESIWYFTSNLNNPYSNWKNLFSNFLFKFKEVYENEWLRSMFSLFSGISNIMKDKENTKLKYTILLCLTICPWLAYPMLRYSQTNDLDTDVKTALSIQLDVSDVTTSEFRTYSTYFSSVEDYTNTSRELFELLQQKNLTTSQFVREFKKIAKSVFGEGRLPDVNPDKPFEIETTWDYYEMDYKFNRLINRLSCLPDLV